jgi:hypothetical protein
MTDPSYDQFLSGMMRGQIVGSTVITPDREYAYEVKVLDFRFGGSNLTDARNKFKPLPDTVKINAAPDGTDCIVFMTANRYCIWVPEQPQTTECDDAGG